MAAPMDEPSDERKNESILVSKLFLIPGSDGRTGRGLGRTTGLGLGRTTGPGIGLGIGRGRGGPVDKTEK